MTLIVEVTRSGERAPKNVLISQSIRAWRMAHLHRLACQVARAVRVELGLCLHLNLVDSSGQAGLERH